MAGSHGMAGFVFVLTIVGTLAAALLGRSHSSRDQRDGLAGLKLNRWLVGLSAGTAANSGFIVTAAVGLGYAYGLVWVLLPLSWLMGDVVFWYFFPARINSLGRESRATTMSELLLCGLTGPSAAAIAFLAAIVILVCLAGYTSAQWLAGQKFLAGAFGLPDYVALGLFAAIIIIYSGIGGFRGSVYTDVVQAIIRVLGTVVAVAAVVWFAFSDWDSFLRCIHGAGSDFLDLFPGTMGATVGFIFGFALAAIGFGLGQPQIVSRYLAGSSPDETRAAWPIYILFVQLTWISMTVFGVMLRGVMPGIPDPEAGLSLFFQRNLGPLPTGVIAADVFATIAATSNALLIAMAQATKHDILPKLLGRYHARLSLGVTTIAIGVSTMAVSTILHGSVMTIAVSSISMMGAGIAGAVMIKVLRWPHTGASLLMGMGAGLGAAITWKCFGLSANFNEAGVGIAITLAVNWAFAKSKLPFVALVPPNGRKKGRACDE